MTTHPTTWKEVSLGDICEFKYGKSLPEAKRTGDNVPVYGSNGIVGWHNEALTDGQTIIVGRKGSFGEVNLSTIPCWPIDTTYYIDNSVTEVDLKWLTYCLSTLDLKRLNKSAAIPGLNRDDAYRQRLLLPPLDEQKRIADILDRAEALRAKRRAALTQLDELIQSIYFDLFGDPESNPKRFHISTLAEIVQLRGGFAFKSNDYVNEGIPLVRIGEVNRGNVAKENACFLPYEYKDTYSRFIVKPGDMLMSLTGTTGKDDYGNVILLNDTFDLYFLNQRVALFLPDENVLDKHYLLYVLRHPKVKIKLTAKSRGIRQANISNGDVLELKIPLPSLSLQKEFARCVESIENLKTANKASLAELDELFASLQYRAFRGELGVIPKTNEQSFEGVKI